MYQDNVNRDKIIISFPKDDFQRVVNEKQYAHLTSILESIDFDNQEVDVSRKTVEEDDFDIEFGEYLRIYYQFDPEVKSQIWISDYGTAKNWKHDLIEVNPEEIERDY